MQVTNQATQSAVPTPIGTPKLVGASNTPFASLLRQNQSTPAAVAVPAGSTEPDTAAEANIEADTPAAPSLPCKSRMKPAEKAAALRGAERVNKPGANAEAQPEAPMNEPNDGSGAKRAEAPLTEPALAPWLTAFRQPADERVALNAGDAAAAKPKSIAPNADGLAKQNKVHEDTEHRALDSAASSPNMAPWVATAGSNSVAAERVAEGTSGLKPVSNHATPSAAALNAAVFTPLPSNAVASAPQLLVNLPTPLASADFAQALGVQMSVLVKGGVQHAELQLNPAEMGPVSVQIVIDGARAQVDFGADLAATRQAIEAGLPELAGALRDAGFTLTGGGVSQHSGGRGASQDAASSEHRSGTRHAAQASAAAVNVARQIHTVSAGRVDLYA